MARSRKKKSAPRLEKVNRRFARPLPPDPGPPGAAARECWLCAKPMTDGITASVFGDGVFEVHRHCYEKSLGIESNM